MKFWIRLLTPVRGWRHGQTMTEYALILAAVAVVVFTTYKVLGQDLNSLVTKVDGLLTAT